MLSLPGAGAGAGAGTLTAAAIDVDVRSAKGSTTAGGPLGIPPPRERFPNGTFARGSASSRPARGGVAAVDVGGAGPSNDRRSNNMFVPPVQRNGNIAS